MAKSKAPITETSVRQVSSLVKKDIAALQAHADRLSAFLKSPGAAAIKICECCINVVISKPEEEQQKTRSRRRK
jgi:hypothetical protein